MCNNFGKSQADLIIVPREIFQRFKQIRDFPLARDKRATNQQQWRKVFPRRRNVHFQR